MAGTNSCQTSWSLEGAYPFAMQCIWQETSSRVIAGQPLLTIG